MKTQPRLREVALDRGFGTIEVLVALMLWSFVLLSLIGLFIIALSAGTAAETSTVAMNLARARLEELSTMHPSTVAEMDGATSEEQVPTGQGHRYTVQTSVDTSHADFFDVTVTVSWQVVYGQACAPLLPGTNCTGSTITLVRTLQTRLRRT